MSGPEISVVLPAFDQPGFLREALDSVAAQEHTDFEVIVVDDGSTIDLTPALDRAREQFGDRLRALRQTNAGGAAARNLGIEAARGEWVAFLDHDDVWLPARLRRQIETATPESTMIFCQCEEFGPASEGRVSPQRSAGPITLADLLERTLIKTLSTVMIRRDVFSGEPWFDTCYRFANDIDLYYRIAMRCQIRFLDEVLVRKRIHAAQATRNHVRSHDEMVAITADLKASGLERLVRERWAHHLARAAKSARRDGDHAGSRRRYGELVRRGPGRLRGLRGYLGSLFG